MKVSSLWVGFLKLFQTSQHSNVAIRGPQFEVANCTVAVDAQVQLLCYPRGSFYPLSPVPPTKYTRITRSDFRLCLTCMSHSQASICPCTITSDFNPELGYLWALAVLFSKQPPQLNYPPDSVPLGDPAEVGEKFTSLRVVLHISAEASHLF